MTNKRSSQCRCAIEGCDKPHKVHRVLGWCYFHCRRYYARWNAPKGKKPSRPPLQLYTIGFTKKSAEQFFGLLKEAGVKRVVDVRRRPNSQLAGFANNRDLAWFLVELCDVDYVHFAELAPSPELLDDYRKKRIDWSGYEPRFEKQMKDAKIKDRMWKILRSGDCFLCSEDVPDQCHRRLVAEHLVDEWVNVKVEHLV